MIVLNTSKPIKSNPNKNGSSQDNITESLETCSNCRVGVSGTAMFGAPATNGATKSVKVISPALVELTGNGSRKSPVPNVICWLNKLLRFPVGDGLTFALKVQS